MSLETGYITCLPVCLGHPILGGWPSVRFCYVSARSVGVSWGFIDLGSGYLVEVLV